MRVRRGSVRALACWVAAVVVAAARAQTPTAPPAVPTTALGTVSAATLLWAQDALRDQRDLANGTALSLVPQVGLRLAETVLLPGAGASGGGVTAAYVGASLVQALDLGARRVQVDLYWSAAGGGVWAVCEDGATAASVNASGAPAVCTEVVGWQAAVLDPLAAWLAATASNLQFRAPITLIVSVWVPAAPPAPLDPTPTAVASDLRRNLTTYLLPVSAVPAPTGWLSTAQMFQAGALLIAGWGSVRGTYTPTASDIATLFPAARVNGVPDRLVPPALAPCPVSLNVSASSDPAGFLFVTTTLEPLQPLPNGTVLPPYLTNYTTAAAVYVVPTPTPAHTAKQTHTHLHTQTHRHTYARMVP
jgi:hypothetical protein